MSKTRKSHFTAASLVSHAVEAEPFVPGKLNAFPKYVDAIGGTGSELWVFDAVSEKDQSALIVGFTRNVKPPGQDGFRVQVLGLWPDKSTWARDFYFPESIVTETQGEGVTGVWQDTTCGSSVSWWIAEDASRVSVEFNVPGVVTGKLAYTAPHGDSALDIDADMGPQFSYFRPLARGWAEANVDFEGGLHLALSSQGPHRAHGGFDHGCSKVAWPQLMTESLFIHAQAGPYALQVMRITSDVATGKVPYVLATLFHDGNLVCVPKRVAASRDEAEQTPADALVFTKLHGEGLTGAFRDKNVGYRVEWYQAVGKKWWAFNTRHEAIFWNLPTSPPGPDASGNTGFVDTLTGGAEGERYGGVSVSAQYDFYH